MTRTDPLTGARTLVELLRRRADEAPDRRAYAFLADGEREAAALTFGELDRGARAVAARLAAVARPGDRALLLYPPGLDFTVAFCGCLYAGVVAVPAPAFEPEQAARTLPRLLAVLRDAEPARVLTTTAGASSLARQARGAPELPQLDVLATDAVDPAGADAWTDPASAPEDLAFLQYTSGSTARPKGVMVSHSNLLYTAADIDAGWRYDEHSTMVSWLPIFHDMGLICGIVLPMYKGFECVLMSPVAFIQKPLRWLRAMSDYRATHSAAPNFAYDLCVRKIGPDERAALDLASWDVSLSSAEPVRYETMRRFTDAFAPSGFRWEVFCPGFGLAEATVKVTASRRGEAPRIAWVDAGALADHRVVEAAEGSRNARPIVGCGADDLDTHTLIVDPETREPTPAGAVGEIWVAGPCVAQGYWKRPDATRETFGGRLSVALPGTDPGPYLRTGDLGFRGPGGELFVTGRRKDLLILRGRNVYPQDVEATAEAAHAALRPGCAAAFAVDLDGEERLVLCAEVDPRVPFETDEVLAAVRRALFEEHEAEALALALCAPRSVPKTSSGKVQRQAARRAFERLALEPVALAVADFVPAATDAGRPAAEPLEPALRSALAAALGVEPDALDPARPLAESGLDLAGARAVARALAARTGVRLEAAAFFGGASLHDLLDAARASAPATPALAVAEAPGSDAERAIADWLARALGAKLGVDPARIDTGEPFAQFGLDSLKAIELVEELDEWLGAEIPVTRMWDYPTIDALAAHLAEEHAPPAPAAEPRARVAAEATGEPAVDTDAVAIVGVGCRFPGAHGPDAYWELLEGGVDAITEVPPERFDVERVYDPEPGTPGKLSTRWGGFVEHVDRFDAAFFGISAREAARMDPQQRLLLETAWEALEDAGQSPDRLRGSAAGVFVGIGSADYVRLQLARLDAIDAYAGTGNAYSIAANRISYALDLRGPSVAVDTACSSSLVAAHLAKQSLARGECDLALAGGVNLILSPEWTITFSHASMMAADGRCKTFDAAADGYVRGEGCGFVVLKRLGDALRDGDRVLAVVRGSAVNQDGRSNGITAPNGVSQEAVLRRALADARVDPASVEYVEAHGTGTALGDPIEVRALGAVYGEGRAADSPLVVGSVKTNVGHLEAAAGVASLIKVALGLERGAIPRQLHLQTVNPHIDLAASKVAIATRNRPWPGAGHVHRAGVSSFGFGGTNVHLVLESAPLRAPAEATPRERPRHVVCLSAKSEAALEAEARALADHLVAHPELPLADVAFTLATGRAALPERFACTAATADELRGALASLAGARGRAPKAAPRVALLFTGQGAQHPGMGSGLYATEPVYRAAFDRCAEVLSELDGPDLREVVLAGDGAALARTENTQPALFALEWALFELVRALGIEPAFVLGHSVGELVAACAAGVLTLEDGLRLVAERGRRMGELPAGGVMAAVLTDAGRVERDVAAAGEGVSIAAYNGPSNTVVSGDADAVAELVRAWEADGLRVVPLDVSHAFHSARMEPMLDAFEAAARGLGYQRPRAGLISNLTGAPLAPGEVPDAAYWRRHVREPVRFAEGVAALLDAGVDLVLELGPHPALTEMGRRADVRGVLPRSAWLPTLKRGEEDGSVLGATLAELHARGVPLDWAALDRGRARRRVSLPTYPFERRRYWIDTTHRAPEGAADMTQGREHETNPSARASADALAALVALFREQTAAIARVAGGLEPAARRDVERLLRVAEAGTAPAPSAAAARPSPAPAPSEGSGARNGATAHGDVEESVFALVASISGFPVADLRGDHHLNGDLGFDSLMTVDLDRALRRRFPTLDDKEKTFTEDITVAELVGVLSGNLARQGKMEFLTEHQRERKHYATYADLIQMDPEKTYVGGAFKDESHTLHTIHCEGRSISGKMDMHNKYAGTANFHLTQMGAYSFIVQLIQGYLCYKYGVRKDSLGMPKLREIDMRWKGMVRHSSDIAATVEERHCTEKDGVYTLEMTFDLEDGACTGRLIGICPIRPHADAVGDSHEALTPFQKEARDYATHAELIGMDPRETYQGGVFKDEIHHIHDVELEGRVIKGKMDVTNKYSETESFHLTQMGAYSYIVQLLLGYLCYKHGITKDELGMPTLREFCIRWEEMVPYPKDIPCRVEERSCTVENGRYKLEFGFEIGDGNGRGTLIGLIPLVGTQPSTG